MGAAVSQLLVSMRAVVRGLDVSALSDSDASTWFESFAEIEKLAAAGKVLVTPKLAASTTWSKSGARSAEEWMAAKAGTTVGMAKATVELAAQVQRLSGTQAALRSGSLSMAQAAAVSVAASADPDSEAALLAAAGTEPLRTLQDQSRRVVLARKSSLDERYARQRRLRSFRSWTDDEGMFCGLMRLTPDAGAAVTSAIRAQADRNYRIAYSADKRENSENYAADAVVTLITGPAGIAVAAGGEARVAAAAGVVSGGGTAGTGTDPAEVGLAAPPVIRSRSGGGAEVVVHVSYEALRRGMVDEGAGSGELCEVAGFGAVPVSRARELLADAFLKAVVVDGTRVSHVKHFGRRRSAEIDTALQVRTVLERGSMCCDVEGCGAQVGLEYDHTIELAKGGETSEANLRPLCRFPSP